jgi:hypothetical protein
MRVHHVDMEPRPDFELVADDLRRRLRHASILLASVRSPGSESLVLLRGARHAIAWVVATIDTLVRESDDAEPLTPPLDPRTIKADR